MVACSGAWLFAILLSLPETLRTIVGDGTVAGSGWHTVPLRWMRPSSSSANRPAESTRKGTKTVFRGFFTILCHKDKALVMSAIAILYMVWNCLQASLSTIFIRVYHFNSLQAGLIYIPFGVGVGFAGFVTGKHRVLSNVCAQAEHYLRENPRSRLQVHRDPTWLPSGPQERRRSYRVSHREGSFS